MSDRAIINTISKLHNNIVLFFALIIFISALLFIVLNEGLLIQRLLLPGIKVEQLYIKWDEKLSLTAKQISVTYSNTSKADDFDTKKIVKALHLLRFIKTAVHGVSLESITFNGYRASFLYHEEKEGLFILHSNSLDLHTVFHLDDDTATINVKRFTDSKRKITADATTVVDLARLHSYTKISASIVDQLEIKGYIYADEEALSFHAESDSSLTDLKAVVDLFKLPYGISQWIVDKATGSHAKLHALKGKLPYDNPKQLLYTLYADATYFDVTYTVNDKIGPISSERVDIVFKEGKLTIRPQDPYIYGKSAGKSYLDIDFGGDDFYLNAYILGDIPLHKGIHGLLSNYQIPLPFIQTEGTIDSNLTLTLNIGNTEDFRAYGQFKVDEGVFDYEGLPVRVSSASILLDNKHVTVKKSTLNYKEILEADAKGVLDFGKGTSNLAIHVNKARLQLQDTLVALDTNVSPLSVDYHLSSADEYISLSPSSWRLDDLTFHLDGVKAPFDFDTASLKLDGATITIGNIGRAGIAGAVNLKKPSADLNIDIEDFTYNDVTLLQPPLSLSLSYDDKLAIHTSKELHLGLKESNITISPISAVVKDSNLTLGKSSVLIPDIIKSSLIGRYDFSKRNGDFQLSNIEILNRSLANMLDSDQKVSLNLSVHPDTIDIALPTLKTYIHKEEEHLFLSCSDFSKLSPHYPLLRDYNLTDGMVEVNTLIGSGVYNIHGSVHYPYPLLVIDNVPQHTVAFTGSIRDGMTNLRLMDKVDVHINDEISIKSKGIGYNAKALADFINEHPGDANQSDFPRLSMIAEESYIYFAPASKALADTFTMNMHKSTITASFIHKEGIAIFEVEDDTFYADGQNFNDEFMSALFAASDYRDGRMLFNVSGTLEHADGVFYVENTVIKNYKTLNNILAFVNTVPSLVTFNLPNYSSKGLKVSEAYARFTHKGDKTYFDSVKLDSPEMKIIGQGVTDYTHNLIDMTMTFKTDLGSTVSKIPVVGYLLLGDDGSIATTFKVSGKLDDPVVKTSTVEDIAVAPLNIVKRAITLPFWIFSSDKEEEEEE